MLPIYAARAAGAAHAYARDNNLYAKAQRAAVKAMKEWWRKPTVAKKPTKQGKGSIHTGAFTSYGSNYSNNIKTKGKKGWKGDLVVPYNKKKSKDYKKKLPFTIMQRYFLTPPSNLDSNNVLSFPQDMFTSHPSVDAKHMSTVADS